MRRMSAEAASEVAERVPGLSVVVPVFNAAATLRPLLARLRPVLARAAERYEVVLVNDGSRDGSWDLIEQLCREQAGVRGLNLMRNYGQHNALLAGIRAARFGLIVTLDDDLQNPPEELPRLLAKLAEGFDVVYGAPARDCNGVWRGLASRLIRLALQSAMGAATARRVSAFRALRTELRRGFADYDSPAVSIDVLLTWATTRFAAVTVRHEPRQAGASNYTFGKLAILALDMMTGFSAWPLRLASLVGLGFTLFGLAVLAYVLGRYLIAGGSVPGFPFLASTIAIFSGAQLFALGVIGEYLGRVHFRSMKRPAYVVRAEAGRSEP